MYKKNLIFLFIFLLGIFYLSFYIFNTLTFNNFLKSVIKTQAYYRYGVKVDIGNIKINYFGPSIVFNNFNLINDSKAGTVSYDIKTTIVKIKFSLIKLLSGSVYVSELLFKEADINIIEYSSIDSENDFDFENFINTLLNNKIDKISFIKSNVNFKYKDLNYAANSLSITVEKSLFNNLIMDLKASTISFKDYLISNFKLNLEINSKDLLLNSLVFNIDDDSLFFRGTLFDVYNMFKNKVSDFKLYSQSSINLINVFKKLVFFKILDEDLIIYGDTDLSLTLAGKLTTNSFELQNIESKIFIKDFTYSELDLTVPNIDLKITSVEDILLIQELKIFDNISYTLFNDINISLKDFSVQGVGSFNSLNLNNFLKLFSVPIRSLASIDGKIKLTGYIYPKFELTTLLELDLKDYYLLNKQDLEASVDNSLINFKEAKLYGFLFFDTKKVFLNDIRIFDSKSELFVNGEVFFNGTSYADLNIFTDLFDFSSLKRIAKFDIDGKMKTKLNLNILKNSNDIVLVKGNLNTRDFKLLNYYLGSSNAHIDFSNNILSFNNIETLLSYSKFNTNIKFDYNDNEKLIIKSKAYKVYLEDLYKVFNIENIDSYYPLGLIDFNLSIENSLNKVDSNLLVKAKDIYFLNEKLSSINASIYLKDSEFLDSKINIKKDSSYFNIDLNGFLNNFEFEFKDSLLFLKDLYYFKTRAYDINAKLNTKGKITFFKNNFNFNLNFIVLEYLLKGKNYGESTFKLEGALENINITYEIFNKSLIGNVNISDEIIFNSVFKNFNLFSIFSLYKDNFISDSLISGAFNFKYNIKTSIIDSYSLKDFSINLNYNDLKIYSENINLNVSKDLIDFGAFTLSSQSVDSLCNLNFKNNNNQNTINGCINADVFSFLSPINDINGNIIFDLKIYNEKLLFVDGLLFTNEVNISLKDIGNYSLEGRYTFDKSKLILNNVNLDSFNGSLIFNGSIDFLDFFNFKASSPKVDLLLDIKNFSFNFFKGISGFWAGALSFNGLKAPYTLSGDLILFNGEFRKEFESLELTQKTVNKTKSNLLNLDLKLKTRNDFLIKNDLFDGNLVFDIQIIGDENNVIPKGNINILRGRIFYNDHEFKLNSGKVFLYEDNTNSYQIDSEARILEYQVFMQITGQNGEYSINIYSTPSLSETELISLLTTGELYSEFSTDPTEFKLNIGQGSFLDNLSITRGLREEAGIRINLKKDQKSSMPSIGLEKKFTDDLKLKFEKSLDDTINKQEINVQYDINRNTRFRLLLEEDKSDDRQQDSTKAGFDFRFRFEF